MWNAILTKSKDSAVRVIRFYNHAAIDWKRMHETGKATESEFNFRYSGAEELLEPLTSY